MTDRNLHIIEVKDGKGTDVSLATQLAPFVDMFDKYSCVKNLLLQCLFKQCGYSLFVFPPKSLTIPGLLQNLNSSLQGE